ncbi:MAG: hypothetical protein ABFS28_00725 [Bacteroidota bacterium]
MKIGRFTYICLLTAFSFGSSLLHLQGQSPFDPAYHSVALKFREQVNVFTDRSIYAVGETLRFRADYSVSTDVPGGWSTVLYAELVTSAGMEVVQGKFPLSNGVSTGSLHIPSGILTGNYYLKCYTRWMRNAGPGCYSYTPLKIINPNRLEVANGNSGNGYQSRLTSLAYLQGEIGCSSDASVYGKGKEVSLTIEGPCNAYVEHINCCVSVVPAGAIDTVSGQLLLSSGELNKADFSIAYLPDVGHGPSLSGLVVHPDNSPAAFTGLHFSILGRNPGFFATVTDASGRFAVSTPDLSGTQEFYVSTDSRDDAMHEVRIDQDFDASPFQLPAVKFSLSDWERKVATRMSLAMQFSRVYGIPVQPVRDSLVAGFNAFYGNRVQRLQMDDYVNLPTLEEVFINLVPNVDVVRKKGKNSIRIHSDNRVIGIYSPLILIDNISVFDHDAVLALPPEKIDRIDLINEVYLKGSMSFGGLIAIYSKDGDLAGIDLAPGSYFFDFQSFYEEPEAYVASPSPGDRIPDMRNTILWKEDLPVRKDRPGELKFTAPSTPGEYVILVRAVAPDGELWSASSLFSVE